VNDVFEMQDILLHINAGLRVSWVDDVGWAMDVNKTTLRHLQTRTKLLQEYRELQGVDYALVCNDAFVSGVWFTNIHLIRGSVGDLKPNADAKNNTIISYILTGDTAKIRDFEKIGVVVEANSRKWSIDIVHLKDML
jgi:hypothetical protein